MVQPFWKIILQFPKRLLTILSHWLELLRWETYRNGDQITGSPRWRGWRWERSGYGYKRTTWEIAELMEIFCILIVSVSILWLCHWTMVLQDITIWGNWVKSTLDLFILFLTTVYESMIVSKQKVNIFSSFFLLWLLDEWFEIPWTVISMCN